MNRVGRLLRTFSHAHRMPSRKYMIYMISKTPRANIRCIQRIFDDFFIEYLRHFIAKA